MRLITFSEAPGGQSRVGALLPDDPEAVLDLTGAGLTTSMEELIGSGTRSLTEIDRALGEDSNAPNVTGIKDVRLLPPLRPASLKDFIAFEDHARAGASRRGEPLADVWFERPLYYKGNHRSILGPDEPLARPSFTTALDFELEVACILGANGRDLGVGDAEAAIFGYTVMNDWSARDVQRVEMAARLGPARSKDFATSLGPCILTADEAGARPSLPMVARVNGEVLCESNLSRVGWTFGQMISFVSEGEDVFPGDVYGSGTPYGGCLLDHGGPYLEPGDMVELEVTGIGTLRTRVT